MNEMLVFISSRFLVAVFVMNESLKLNLAELLWAWKQKPKLDFLILFIKADLFLTRH